MAISVLKGLGKAFLKSAKKTGKAVQKKVDKFAEKEIKKMNSKKASDQISAWSKPGIPATVYAVKKTADDKKKK
jgi:hypothetical protein